MTDSTDNAQGPERIAFRKVYMTHAITSGPLMDHPDYVQYIRADLVPDPLGAVKVKPLVWDSGPLECVSILGKYHIGRIGCSWWLRLNNQEIDRGTSWSFEGSGEAAKAAAQANYEKRIRSALELDPQDARVAALVEALKVYTEPCDGNEHEPCGYEGSLCCKTARAALAAFDKGKGGVS